MLPFSSCLSIAETGPVTLIAHDHVGDSGVTSTTVAEREPSHSAWALEFGETIVTKTSSEGAIQRPSALLVLMEGP